jgi:predicted alpha/beta hydrolase
LTEPAAAVVVLLRGGREDLDAAVAATRLACATDEVEVGMVADDIEAQALLMAMDQGRPVVAAAAGTGALWSRFVRAAEELARPVRWETTRLSGLSATQIELLWALGDGLRLPAAARVATVSERSAHRQLIAARSLLGARTNSHAATMVRDAITNLA